jgi:hypothetical protein
MDHIGNERLKDFANDCADLTEDENNHLDECATCWARLVATVQLVVLLQAEPKNDLIM